jgi:nicotinamide-nucleotide amidase
MDLEALLALGTRVGDRLVERGETVSVADGSSGGLISTALLARPGASAYYLGGATIYTRPAATGLIAGAVEAPAGLRGASEPWVQYLSESVATRVGTTWGIGEGGATGPTGNPYGDPAGHAWVAVHGPTCETRHVLTGDDDRPRNMVAFATAALELLADTLDR